MKWADLGAIFLPSEKTKLTNIEDNATADQTGAEIKTAYEGEADTNAFDDAAVTKLSGIESGADMTDATNVDASGAVMESDDDVAFKQISAKDSDGVKLYDDSGNGYGIKIHDGGKVEITGGGTSKLHINDIPVYASNAVARGGIGVGGVYRNGNNLCIVWNDE